MSTKKLSRTVIEGGRHSYNKWERRHTHAEVRAEERDYLKQVMVDPDLADEIDVDQGRSIRKEFTDKLRPMYRWLEAQVGRLWSEVRSEVFTKFDTRTTAGRHITFDHLLREVVDTESGFDNRGRIADPAIPLAPQQSTAPYRWYRAVSDYYVDKDGVLRAREDIHHRLRHRLRYAFVSEQEYKNAEAWLNGRMIGEKGGKLYWFVATERIWAASWHYIDKPYEAFNPRNDLKYFVRENGSHQIVSRDLLFPDLNMTGMVHSDYWQEMENPFSFRQRGELTAEEIKTFRALKEKIRDDILVWAKNR